MLDDEELYKIYIPVYRFLDSHNIYDVRSLARAFGVNAPTSEKKHELMMRLIGVASGARPPERHSNKGARVKASDAPIADVEEVRRLLAECKEAHIATEAFRFQDGMEAADRGATCRGAFEATAPVGGRLYGEGGKELPVIVPQACIERYSLREGDLIYGYVCDREDGRVQLDQIVLLNGEPPVFIPRRKFEECPALYPQQRISFARASGPVLRALDLIAPIGRGQRALLYAAGGEALAFFREAAPAAAAEGLHTFLVLLDQRPEDLTETRDAAQGATIYSASFDETPARQVRAARLALERCKRIAESGGDALLLLDSMTALSRAYAAVSGEGGEWLAVKQFFASARNLQGAGSLTVIAAVYDEKSGGALAAAANAELWCGASDQTPPLLLERCRSERAELLLSEEERQASARLRAAAERGGTRGALEEYKKIDDPSEKS